MLAVVIFATSVVSGPVSLTAQAASVAVSPEVSVEFVIFRLYTSGADDERTSGSFGGGRND